MSSPQVTRFEFLHTRLLVRAGLGLLAGGLLLALAVLVPFVGVLAGLVLGGRNPLRIAFATIVAGLGIAAAIVDHFVRSGASVVYLLGGSSARESITSEPSWRAQIAASGGGRVRAYNFGSSSETYAADISVVERAPDVPTLVLIGVNVGRYTSQYPTAAAPAAGPRNPP